MFNLLLEPNLSLIFTTNIAEFHVNNVFKFIYVSYCNKCMPTAVRSANFAKAIYEGG